MRSTQSRYVHALCEPNPPSQIFWTDPISSPWDGVESQIYGTIPVIVLTQVVRPVLT